MKHYLKDVGSSGTSGSYKPVWPYVVIEVFWPCNEETKRRLLTVSAQSTSRNHGACLTCWVQPRTIVYNLWCLFIFKTLDSLVCLKQKGLARFTPRHTSSHLARVHHLFQRCQILQVRGLAMKETLGVWISMVDLWCYKIMMDYDSSLPFAWEVLAKTSLQKLPLSLRNIPKYH